MKVSHRLRAVVTGAVRCTRGSALVELALVSPMLAFILLGTLDFGRVFHVAVAVTHAVRAGAQVAVNNTTSSTSAMSAAATAAATEIGGFTVTSATKLCTCYSGSSTAYSAPASPTTTACSASCSGRLWVYAQVTATVPFRTVGRYPGVPGSASALTITRTARVRVQ